MAGAHARQLVASGSVARVGGPALAGVQGQRRLPARGHLDAAVADGDGGGAVVVRGHAQDGADDARRERRRLDDERRLMTARQHVGEERPLLDGERDRAVGALQAGAGGRAGYDAAVAAEVERRRLRR
jgi:hypothetical protein